MDRVFVDSDIVLDLLMARNLFYWSAADLFSLADLGYLNLHVSSLTFANVHYMLSRQLSARKARQMLIKFKALVAVLPVNDKIIQVALASEMSDFEDAIQYHTALENGLEILLTRNLRDFRKAQMTVLTAHQYLQAR